MKSSSKIEKHLTQQFAIAKSTMWHKGMIGIGKIHVLMIHGGFYADHAASN
jgi:hypothetical protein